MRCRRRPTRSFTRAAPQRFWRPGRSTPVGRPEPPCSGWTAPPPRCSPPVPSATSTTTPSWIGPRTGRARRGRRCDGGRVPGRGVDRYAVWMHESDEAMRTELLRRGYTFDSATRAMGMSLDDLSPARPEIELGTADWPEYLRLLGVPAGLLAGADPAAFHILVARRAGENVATAIGYRPPRRLRRVQRDDARTGPAARDRHRAHRTPAPRCRRARLFDRQPAGHRRWRSGSTRPSGSATWAGSSSTCPDQRYSGFGWSNRAPASQAARWFP